ncbi:MAG: DUF1343 domain-containing protein [Desulfobacteraceae bacterium]|nr:MAG: DUF1343 domain-containing protein [Desulfobacteraceae bacterium]
MASVLTGLDRVSKGELDRLKGIRIGLLANQASLDSSLSHAKDVIFARFPGRLKALFGPQHGYGGHDQDNMIETGHNRDKELNIPIFSLYADKREPLPWMFDEIDLLIIDLQDVGTRVYTFAATMLGCLRVSARMGKKVLILDRPNPLGGDIMEGNLLSPDLYSFVGPWRMPMRHGLTMGEMALLFNRVLQLDCDLEVIPLKGWRRSMLWKDTGIRWLMPSPNMPLAETAMVYPGQVLWEATNLSEGRGTCRPFEIFGAPYLDIGSVMESLPHHATEGCTLQPYYFRPTFNKWAGELCKGFMIHITDPFTYMPYRTSLYILQAVLKLHGDAFLFKAPPYEYEYVKRPIDIILGDASLTRALEQGASINDIEGSWKKDIDEFSEARMEFLIY